VLGLQTVGSLLRGNALRNAAAKSVSFGSRPQGAASAR